MIEDKLKPKGSKLLEVRQGITFEPGHGDFKYRIETYIFSPVSLHINSQTFKPHDCLHLFRNYLRLRSPNLPLESLASSQEIKDRFGAVIDELGTAQEPDAPSRYKKHLRTYTATFVHSLHVYSNSMIRDEEFTEAFIRNFVEMLRKAREVYKKEMPRLAELDKKFRTGCSKFCDEYMTDISLNVVQDIVSKLEPGPRRDILIAFWNEENAWRLKMHPESEALEENAADKNLYRYRLLSKYVECYLFLNIHAHTEPTLLVHSLYGLAAALSMIFATVVAFVWQGEYGSLSWNLFVALVIAYIFKDRFKALLQQEFSTKFKKWIPDRRLEIYLNDEAKVGKCSESFSFVDLRQLPERIRELRQKYQTVKGIYNWRFENILVYKKEMTIHRNPRYFNDARYALLDTTWINLEPFLTFIDAKQARVPVAGSAIEKPPYGEKYYHIYLVRSTTTYDKSGKKFNTRDEVTRIAVDYQGIRSVEVINTGS